LFVVFQLLEIKPILEHSIRCSCRYCYDSLYDCLHYSVVNILS